MLSRTFVALVAAAMLGMANPAEARLFSGEACLANTQPTTTNSHCFRTAIELNANQTGHIFIRTRSGTFTSRLRWRRSNDEVYLQIGGVWSQLDLSASGCLTGVVQVAGRTLRTNVCL